MRLRVEMGREWQAGASAFKYVFFFEFIWNVH